MLIDSIDSIDLECDATPRLSAMFTAPSTACLLLSTYLITRYMTSICLK